MPNRIIKDSIRTSDDINELSWFEEVLFYRLIVSCDDYGRYDGRPAVIKGTCFTLKDNVTGNSIEKALSRLATVGLVVLYEVDGKPYLQLPSWERHQTIRAKKSKYPAIENGQVKIFDSNCMQTNANVPVIQSNTNSKSESKNNNNVHKAEALALFERLWEEYPNKKGKASVSQKTKERLLTVGEEHMLRCIERYKTELQKDSDWRKPQNGSTFFNKGYEDYLDGNYKPSETKPKNNNTSKFQNFEQREYDMDNLTKALLN